MTNERIEELRKHADRFNVQPLHEALDEVERLHGIALEAVAILEEDDMHRSDFVRLRAEIERKP